MVPAHQLVMEMPIPVLVIMVTLVPFVQVIHMIIMLKNYVTFHTCFYFYTYKLRYPIKCPRRILEKHSFGMLKIGTLVMAMTIHVLVTMVILVLFAQVIYLIINLENCVTFYFD